MAQPSFQPRFQPLGDVSKFKELDAIYRAITNHDAVAVLPSGAKVRTKIMGHPRKLFAIDHAGIRYVEQNPATTSQYALRARRGAKIIWIIRLKSNQYMGYIEDGQVFQKPGV